jgi:hypothetical protein
MNAMLTIYAAVLTCAVKTVVYDRNCALAGAAGRRLPRLLSHALHPGLKRVSGTLGRTAPRPTVLFTNAASIGGL